MSNGESANPFLHALKVRHALVLKITVAILLVAGGVAYLLRQYSASAVVALNPNARPDPGTDAVEIAWNALTDEKISALIRQFQLDTGLAELRSHGQTFTYLRSNILFNQINSPIDSQDGSSPQVVVSYTGENRSTVIAVANSIAQILAAATAPSAQPAPAAGQTAAGTTSSHAISAALQKVQANLQLLAQSQKNDISRAEVEKDLKTDAELKAAQNEISLQLAALQQQSERDTIAIAKARTPPPPPPPDPARVALEQQIQQAQSTLNALRQRYTDQYPDVQDARAALTALEAKLARLPAEKPLPRPAENIAPLEGELLTIARQQDDLRAEESGIEQKIKANADAAELLRQRLADQQALAEDYAQEQRRYNTLLLAQQAQQAQARQATAGQEGAQQNGALQNTPQNTPQNNGANGSAPLFIVVKSAETAALMGIVLNPLFWIASLGIALLAASFVALLAEQFDPLDVEEEIEETARSHSLHIT